MQSFAKARAIFRRPCFTKPLPCVVFVNKLTASLPREEFARLHNHLEPIFLKKGKIIYYAGDAVSESHFPLGGMISLVSTAEEGSGFEVAMISKEGMAGR